MKKKKIKKLKKAIKEQDYNILKILNKVDSILRLSVDNNDIFSDIMETLFSSDEEPSKKQDSKKETGKNIADDLKENYRDWEHDCDNQECADKLFVIMKEKYSNIESDVLKNICNDWVGFSKEELPEPIKEIKVKKKSKTKDK